MKKCAWISSLLWLWLFGSEAKAQSQEAQQLLLNVEKLAQLKTILSNLKKGYEVLYNGYTRIKSISEGSFSLHDQFLNSLLQVSPSVRKYKRVTDIIRGQMQLVKEHKASLQRSRSSGLLAADELNYLENVYAALLSNSLQNLDALAAILTAGKFRMSDDERLRRIDLLWKDMEDKLVFLRSFDNRTKLLLLQRQREQQETATLKRLHSIKH